MDRAITAEQLLSEASWLRRLAARLADDRDDADDLAQDAWIAAWQRQPDASRPLRPWLAKVVRDAAKMRRRAAARRSARERAVADAAAISSPEDLLAQARLHQTLVELVLALDEPYRATVLARYVDGRSAAEIARASGVPEGTVRWRLSEALGRLRDQLDARARKRAWLPWAGPGAARPLAMSGGTKAIVSIIAAMLLFLAVLLGLGPRPGRGSGPSPTPPVSTDRHLATQRSSAADVPSWLAPAGATTRPIAGRVVTDAGAPIAGAVVELQSWPTGAEEARAITGSDGVFRFAPRWAGSYFVAASATQRAPASIPVDSRGPSDGSDPDQLVIILAACTQAIEGTVSDAGGGPVAAATIRRLTPQRVGPFGPAVTADVDGHYAMCLPRGTSWIDIGADGYEHILREITAHDGRLRVDVALAPGASATGEVVDAATGQPIAGAWVALWPLLRRSGEGADRNAITDADGRFAVEGLSLGRYALTATDDSHAKAVIDEVNIGSVNGTALATVRMERGAIVHGSVRSGGAPVGNARVGLEVPGYNWGGLLPAPIHVVTDADGTFTLRGVPRMAGLTPTVATYAVQSPTTLDTTGPGGDLVIAVEPLQTLHGRVLRDGRSVAEAVVTVRDSNRNDLSGRTGLDGAFSIPGLAAGTYKVFATSDAAGAYSTHPVVITIPTSDDAIVDLDAGATLSGVLRDDGGAPVVGAEVVAKDEHSDDYAASISAIDGSFSINTLAGGAYRLHVRPYPSTGHELAWSGSPPPVITIANGEGHAGPITLAVKRPVRPLAGTVVDELGAPVSDAIVRLGPIWGWTSTVPIARTTSDGRFELSAVGDGPFTLDAGTGGGPQASLTDVAPGTTDVVLRIVRPGSIAGTVTGLSGARIWLSRAGGITGAASVPGNRRTVLARDDRFSFDGLVPGDYTLLAVSATNTAAARVHIEAGSSAAVAMVAGPTRRITGSVTVFADGGPVAAATCVAVPSLGDLLPPAVDASLPQRGVTGVDGSFTIEHAPAGDALVKCFPPVRYARGATILAAGSEHAVVEVATAPPQVMGETGFDLDQTLIHAVVANVYGDEAQRVGIAPGDRLIAVDGVNVESLYVQGVMWLIGIRPFGTSARITFDRSGSRFDREFLVSEPTPH